MVQRVLCCFFIITLLSSCSTTEKITPKQPIQCDIKTFESRAGMNAGEAESVTEMFTSALQNTGRFVFIERKQLNAVLQEQGLQSIQSGENATQTGKILAVRKIFSGSIGMVGEKYVLTLKMIDVESSRIDFARSWSYDDDLEDIDEEFLPNLIQEVVRIVDGMEEK